MKKIALIKETLRELDAREIVQVAGADPTRSLAVCAATARACAMEARATLTCAPCSCPGPLTHLPVCPA